MGIAVQRRVGNEANGARTVPKSTAENSFVALRRPCCDHFNSLLDP